jgi:hypothetical protein
MWYFNLPISQQQNQTADIANEHSRIFIDAIFEDLDERWKRNRHQKQQDLRYLINPPQSGR